MKKLTLYLASLLISYMSFSQAPQSFNYQAVLRNAAGQEITNTSVGIQISLLQYAADGSAVYVERFTKETNNFGLINLMIGTGDVQSGVFADIDWGAGPYFLKVELDEAGGTTYIEIGISQLISVPYALHAKTAANTFSGNYNDLSDAPTSVSTFTNDAGYLTTEVDGDETNEIQTLSVNGNILAISGTGGNTVSLPVSGNVQAVTRTELDALTPEVGELAYNTTAEVILMWNGSNWMQLSNNNCFPQPTTADAGSDQTINTSETSTTLAANTPVEGTGTWSVVSGTGGSFTDANNPTTIFTGSSCTEYSLEWEIATACTESTDNVDIAFDAQPTTANAGNDIYSPTQTSVTLNGNNPTVGTGVWSIISGSGGLFNNSNSYNTIFTGNNNESYTLRWTITTECNDSYDEVNVYIGHVIGQYLYGGVIFYIDETGNHGLVCAVSYPHSHHWGCEGTAIIGADGIAIGTGSQNTIDIVAGCTTETTAADICTELTINSHSDWFLPSYDELNAMYQNRIAINTTALANSGVAFFSGYYWTSTEADIYEAACQNFSNGMKLIDPKDIDNFVRPVRAF